MAAKLPYRLRVRSRRISRAPLVSGRQSTSRPPEIKTLRQLFFEEIAAYSLQNKRL
ncbi:hypothetical protein KL86PLE_40071 [uncultured Pleomorphomonas sp.]|uniref:Uncharacterized protein n=1 Tax=uncultured Pleomorphomonas sp. TaxID=442121 RepID=A0A212LFB5_9HYPH|nr:hypothetical protein KL86PLE_40071 [uncultured Pleomorphomonas sp.]